MSEENKISEVESRFDQVASQWDANPGRVALAKAVAETIRTVVPLRSEMQVMDFGAGTGLLTLALQPWVGMITAVDASRQMLCVLERKLADLKCETVRTLHGDIAEASLPEASFYLVVSSMALHHLRDVPAVLARLRPCLRPGGWVALADLDTEDGSFHSDAAGVYHHGFCRSEMRQWMTQAGFTDARTLDAYRIEREGRQYSVFLAVARWRGDKAVSY